MNTNLAWSFFTLILLFNIGLTLTALLTTSNNQSTDNVIVPFYAMNRVFAVDDLYTGNHFLLRHSNISRSFYNNRAAGYTTYFNNGAAQTTNTYLPNISF